MKIKHIETLLDETQLLVEYEDGFEEIFEAKFSLDLNCIGCYFHFRTGSISGGCKIGKIGSPKGFKPS